MLLLRRQGSGSSLALGLGIVLALPRGVGERDGERDGGESVHSSMPRENGGGETGDTTELVTTQRRFDRVKRSTN